MKRLFLLSIVALLLTNLVSATENKQFNQTGNDRFSIKAQGIMGFYIDVHDNMRADMPSAPTGLMFGMEFPSAQQHHDLC